MVWGLVGVSGGIAKGTGRSCLAIEGVKVAGKRAEIPASDNAAWVAHIANSLLQEAGPGPAALYNGCVQASVWTGTTNRYTIATLRRHSSQKRRSGDGKRRMLLTSQQM